MGKRQNSPRDEVAPYHSLNNVSNLQKAIDAGQKNFGLIRKSDKSIFKNPNSGKLILVCYTQNLPAIKKSSNTQRRMPTHVVSDFQIPNHESFVDYVSIPIQHTTMIQSTKSRPLREYRFGTLWKKQKSSNRFSVLPVEDAILYSNSAWTEDKQQHVRKCRVPLFQRTHIHILASLSSIGNQSAKLVSPIVRSRATLGPRIHQNIQAQQQGNDSGILPGFIETMRTMIISSLEQAVSQKLRWKIPALAASLIALLCDVVGNAKSKGGKIWSYSSLVFQIVSILCQTADLLDMSLQVEEITASIVSALESEYIQVPEQAQSVVSNASDIHLSTIIDNGAMGTFVKIIDEMSPNERSLAIFRWNRAHPKAQYIPVPSAPTSANTVSVSVVNYAQNVSRTIKNPRDVLNGFISVHDARTVFPFLFRDPQSHFCLTYCKNPTNILLLSQFDMWELDDVQQLRIVRFIQHSESLSDFWKENEDEIFLYNLLQSVIDRTMGKDSSILDISEDNPDYISIDENCNIVDRDGVNVMTRSRTESEYDELFLENICNQAVDFSKLKDKFKSFSPIQLMSYLVMFVVSFIVGKFVDIKSSFGKQIISGFSHVNKIKDGFKNVDSIAEWINVHCFGEETVEETMSKKYIEVNSKLEKFLTMQNSEFYEDLTLLDDFKTAINEATSLVSAKTTIAKAAGDMLAGTLIASKKSHTAIHHGLKTNVTRIVPVVIYLWGGEGVGKTSAVEYLVSKLSQQCALKKNKYVFNAGKYWPVYNMQQFGHFEEMFSEKDIKGKAFYDDFNSIVSSAPYLMQGAAVENKEMPCNFHFLFITSNVHPREIKTLMPVHIDAISSVYSRMHIFECRYNCGATEAAKPRDKRRRLDNLGHLNFHPCIYNKKQEKCCEPADEFLNAAELLDILVAKYRTAVTNRTKTISLSQQVGPIGQGKYCVCLHGPGGSGKSYAIAETVAHFRQLYGMSIFNHSVSGLMHDGVGVHIFDDFIKITSTPAEERTFMEHWNVIPAGSIVIVATNVSPKIKTKLNGIMNTLTQKSIVRHIRKLKFNELGLARRMGYNGEISVSGTTMFCDDTTEFYVRLNCYTNAETGIISTVSDLPAIINRDFTTYLARSRQMVMREVAAIHRESLPTMVLSGSQTIIEDLKSQTAIIKMMIGKSSNGNSILLPVSLANSLTGINASRLIPQFQIKYDEENCKNVIKHFVHIVSIYEPNFALEVKLEDIPHMYYSGGVLQIAKNASSDCRIHEISENGEINIFYDSQYFKINLIDLHFDMQLDPFPVLSYSSLPTPVLLFARNKAENLSAFPSMTVQLNKRIKAKIVLQFKNKTIGFVNNFTQLIKDHPFISAFIALLISLGSTAFVVSKILHKKKRELGFGQKYYLALVNDKFTGGNSAEKCHHQFRKMNIHDKIDVLKEVGFRTKFITPSNLEIQEQKKKNKGKIGKSWSRKVVFPSGVIEYYDDDGNIVFTSHPEYRTRKWKDVFATAYDENDYESDDDDDFDSFAGPSAWNKRYGLEQKRKIRIPKPQSVDIQKWKPFVNVPVCFEPIRKKIDRNLVYLCVDYFGLGNGKDIVDIGILGTSLYGLGLRDNYILAPRHVLRLDDGGMPVKKNHQTHVYVMDGTASKTKAFRAIPRFVCEISDICILQVVDKSFGCFVDIVPHFASEEKIPLSFPSVLYKPGDIPRNSKSKFDLANSRIWNENYDDPGDCEQLLFGTTELILEESIQFPSGDALRCADSFYGKVTTPLTTEGTCGLPYFRNEKSATNGEIVGIHIGCHGMTVNQPYFHSLFAFVSREFLEKAFDTPVAQNQIRENIKHESVDYFNPFVNQVLEEAKSLKETKTPDLKFPLGASVSVIGPLNRNISPEMDNPYKPTPFSANIRSLMPILVRPIEQNPARLDAMQIRDLSLLADGTPSARATQEYLWDTADICAIDPTVSSFIVDEMSLYYSTYIGELDILDLDEALNGVTSVRRPGHGFGPMDVHTSPGFEIMSQFPGVNETSQMIEYTNGKWNFNSTDASKYLQFQHDLDFQQALKGNIPVFIYKNCVKVEKLPMNKYHKPRLFTIACKRQVLLERRVMGTFYRAFTDNENFSCRVGMHSVFGMHKMYNRAKNMGKQCMVIDYSRYDKSIPSGLFKILIKIIKKIYIRNLIATSKYNHNQIQNLINAVVTNCYRSMHVSGNTVYIKTKGMCSGCPGTAVLNSLINDIMQYAAYIDTYKNKQEIVDYRSYRERCVDETYGDDLNKTPSPLIIARYTPEKIKNYLFDTFGVLAKSAAKDGTDATLVPIGEMSLCSRTAHFIKDTNIVIGALKPEAISGLLHWCTSDDPQQLASQLSTAYFEESLLGPDHCEKMQKIIKIAIRKVPQLSSMITMSSYKYLTLEITRNFYSLKVEPSRDEIVKENSIQIAVTTEKMDYISCLNRLWQAGKITAPCYSDDNTGFCTFDIIGKNINIIGSGSGFNKTERKRKAALDAYNKYRKICPEQQKKATNQAFSADLSPFSLFNSFQQNVQQHSAQPALDLSPAPADIPKTAPTPSSTSGTTSGANNALASDVLAAGIAPPPSLLVNPGGSITGTGMPAAGELHLDPGAAPPYIPAMGGRPMDVEAILWGQYLPLLKGDITSASADGVEIFRISAEPALPTTLHKNYAAMHSQANYCNLIRLLMFGASDIAGAWMVSWVPDISREDYSHAELMLYDYKILDLSATKSFDVVVSDARRVGGFRSYPYDAAKDPDPCPGVIFSIFSQLNNKFSSDAYTIKYQALACWHPTTAFNAPTLAPVTAVIPTSNLSNADPLPFTSFNLSQITDGNFDLFIGGSTVYALTKTFPDDLVHYPISELHGIENRIIGPANWTADNDNPIIVSGSYSPQNSLTGITQSVISGVDFAELYNKDGSAIHAIKVTDVSGKITSFGTNTILPATFNGDAHVVHALNDELNSAMIVRSNWETGNDFLYKPVDPIHNHAHPDDSTAGMTHIVGTSKFDFLNLDLSKLQYPLLYDKYPTDIFPLVLGEVTTLLPPNPLAGNSRRLDFIVPGQTATVARDNYYPLVSPVGMDLFNLLNEWCETYNAPSLVFDISNSSGVIAVVGFAQNSHFQVLSERTNVVRTGLNARYVSITNIRRTASLSSLTTSNLSSFVTFITPVRTKHIAPRRSKITAVRQQAAALAVMGGLGGLFQGIGSGLAVGNANAQAQKDRDLAKWNSEGSWQNNLDQTKMAGLNQVNLANTQGMNARMTAVTNGEIALKNAGILSNSSLSNARPTRNTGVTVRSMAVTAHPSSIISATTGAPATRTIRTQTYFDKNGKYVPKGSSNGLGSNMQGVRFPDTPSTSV